MLRTEESASLAWLEGPSAEDMLAQFIPQAQWSLVVFSPGSPEKGFGTRGERTVHWLALARDLDRFAEEVREAGGKRVQVRIGGLPLMDRLGLALASHERDLVVAKGAYESLGTLIDKLR